MAIWRLIHVHLIAAKSGMYPTFDPTWYAPTTVMLAVLEVNGATVCASIPLAASRLSRFSSSPPPALGSKGIMVTRDVRIERTPRHSLACEKHAVDEQLDGHLDNSWIAPPEWRQKSECSTDYTSQKKKKKKRKGGIVVEVEELGCCDGEGLNSHYRDSFIRAQVDPFNTYGRVRSVITAGPNDGC